MINLLLNEIIEDNNKLEDIEINNTITEETNEEIKDENNDDIVLNKDDIEYGNKYKISISTLKELKNYFDGIITDKEDEENFCYNNWMERFEENPYKFMEVDGFGFKRCDALAKKIGFDMESPFRILAYVNRAIELNSNGSTILIFTDIVGIIKRDLEIKDIKKIMKILMSKKGQFTLLDNHCKRLSVEEIMKYNRVPEYVTTNAWYNAEKFCYEWLLNLSKMPTTNIDINITENVLDKVKTLNKKQKEIVENIINKNINIIIGKSGSGKSYVTKQVLNILDGYGFSYCLLTPTGIASINLKEKTNKSVQTIHRRYFTKNKKNEIKPIKEDYVIIDEIGMLGADHFNMLSRLIPNKDKRVIFIGDANQLPSISAGDFLSSITKLIRKGKFDGRIFELSEIMRASYETFVPYLCNMFCGYEKFNKNILNKKLKNVTFLKRQNDICQQIKEVMEINNWDFHNTAILIPQKVGDYGCNKINNFFQEMNKSEVLFKDKFKCFKRGDKLMHIKNNNKLKIYNGEWIEIIDVIKEESESEEDTTYLFKRYGTETSEKNILSYDLETISNEVMVAYAVTVHKCQGSTIKNVIFVAIPEHQYMLTRELVYTGMSRTANNLVIIGEEQALEKASFRKVSNTRRTFLELLCKML